MKTRIFSAIFLIFIAIPLVIAGDKTFSLAIGIVGVFALKEIIDLKTNQGRVPFLMTLLYYVSFLGLVFLSPFEYSSLVGINYLWMSVLILLYLLPCLFFHPKEYDTKQALYFLGITFFLSLACHTIIMIRLKSLWLFLYFILIPILTDTFALLFGLLIGRHPLAPLISPKKTIEGSFFGTLCATMVASTFYGIFCGTFSISIVLITIFLSIVSQMGDLFFSKMKRENDQKDFSNLIPGHGGILDRFDSMLFVSLAYLIVFTLL